MPMRSALLLCISVSIWAEVSAGAPSCARAGAESARAVKASIAIASQPLRREQGRMFVLLLQREVVPRLERSGSFGVAAAPLAKRPRPRVRLD
jgi:hypothetical protein